MLGSGIHLHFIIPHFLGQHIPQSLKLDVSGQLPAAPNRWLVTKKNQDGNIKDQWVIESDFIHSEDAVPNLPTCIIPFTNGKPFRYMGRQTQLSNSRTGGDTFKSLSGNPLTITGYGDINFSSFYPNCLSVFGFHDPNGTIDNGTYSILGWNNDSTDDLLSQSIVSLIQSDSTIDINTQLKNLYKLSLENDDQVDWKSALRTLFYGEIVMDAARSIPDTSKLKVSIGNTGTEALSALLADQLDPDDQSKNLIEEQLESMLMFSKLDHLHTDTGPKFLEARHEKGFSALHSGHLWRIVPKLSKMNPDTGDNGLPPLSPQLASLLHNLNIAQANYDNAQNLVETLKEQLYQDWYKYMLAAYPPLEGREQYPDPDQIRFFIEKVSFSELETLINSTGSLTYSDATSQFQPNPSSENEQDLAHQLLTAWNTVASEIGKENDALKLSQIPGPRFWKANAPSIMISGLPGRSETHTRLHQDYLTLKLITDSDQSVDEVSLSSNDSNKILAQLTGFNTFKLSDQEWKPFILDWEIDLTNCKLKEGGEDFSNTSLQNDFDIDQYGPDFLTNKYKSGKLSIFSGSAIMGSGAQPALLNQLKSFLFTTLKKAGIILNPDDFNGLLDSTDWNSFFTTLKNKEDDKTDKDFISLISLTDLTENPIRTAWEAYKTALQTNVISQTLNGFNEAFLMRRKTAQLPISEPLGFESEQSFSQKVQKLVGTDRSSSPIVAFDFNPIRSGLFKLNRLRLYDNFGEPFDLTMDEKQTTSEPLTDRYFSKFLRPRLAQPTRLNFRWLSAIPLTSAEDQYEDHINANETNDHPLTSPICGWLLPNYIDNTIGVYAKDGSAVGYVDET
ncbi:MAG TPA: hypothetical protein DHN29_10995, partial [Cytophagales bacterium]|nr:hypothetical protein [Cytophagales bacterium]